jgi:ABC-type sugar transport system permease subunit
MCYPYYILTINSKDALLRVSILNKREKRLPMTATNLKTRAAQITTVNTPAKAPERKRQSKWLPLWFLLPTLLVLLALQVGPSLYSLYLSTTRVRGGELRQVGLDNFERLFNSPTFKDSLETTAIYTFYFLVLTVSLGMIIALLLNRRVRFTGIYLVIIFLPWVISDVVAGTMWKWLFQQNYGIAQMWLSPIFGSSLYTSARGAMGIIVAASVWRSLAFTTLLFLGALQTIPVPILESAAIDGANRFQRYFRIIFPLIRPTFLVTVLITSIRAVNTVGLIHALTRGQPGGATQTTSYYLLRTAWEQGDFGTGAAISVILFAINIILTLIYLRLVGTKVEY